MVENPEWQNWRAQELEGLGQVIALAAEVFSTCEVTIEESRRYGPALLVHGMETARAIRLCLGKDIPGPAFALARALNEAVLRGHVILHEISLTELNELLARTQQWQERIPTEEPPPKIEVRGKCWKWVAPGKGGKRTSGPWCELKSEDAKRLQNSVVDMAVLHDLTHGGMTQALQMVHEDLSIGPCHSMQNQTYLLFFAERAALFSIMTWPGALQKYAREIEQVARRAAVRESLWERQAH